MALTDKQLLERDARRDIGAELLGAVREAKAGHWARKTVFAVQPDGAVLRRIERADGTVEKQELLTGPRWELMAARAQSGMSQFEFAQALGVSKRTLENWEQGRAKPNAQATLLIRMVVQFPDMVQRLATL